MTNNSKFKEKQKTKHCIGYNYTDEFGRLVSKSTGIIPFTPIEVFMFLFILNLHNRLLVI